MERATRDPFGDELVALYRDYAADLLEMLWVFVGDKATAEDLVQEAFIRLHRAWPRIEDRDGTRAYLRAIAFNLARSGFRRKVVALRHRPAGPTHGASPEVDVVLREDQVEVAAALRRLPARQRQCVVLRYWTELPPPQIAAELDISLNSVKTHLRRGLAAMEKELEHRS
ncbi:MAG TPA: SigE family RNA polymerase sigma factor [Acidimicrobiales bacterium]